MEKKRITLVSIILVLFFLAYSNQNVNSVSAKSKELEFKQSLVLTAASKNKSKNSVIKQKKYENYKVLGKWKLGSSFTDLLPQLKEMKYQIPDGQKSYDSTIAFYDSNQYLIFEGGILESVIIYKKGQGIKNHVLVGDSVNKVLHTLGKPLSKYSETGAIYYGYGVSYSEQELNIKISGSKVVEISLENYTDGFTDENRVVLSYLYELGDPIADYYTCNTCASEEDPQAQNKDVSDSNESTNIKLLTTSEMESIFLTISKDMNTYIDLLSTNTSTDQESYQSVLTIDQADIGLLLNDAAQGNTETEDIKLAKSLDNYSKLVYDAYTAKSLSFTARTTAEKVEYENESFIAITDAMTLYDKINTYLQLKK